MELDDLRTFVAVAETHSVSQAARQLFLTQPAVTRRLQRLEDSLGSSLVDRRRRPFALTRAGHDVLESCRRVLHSLREVQAAAARDGSPVGELRIGVAHALTEIAMAHPLDAVRKRFPSVDIRLTTGWSRTLLDQVRSGALDAAVILLPEEDTIPAGVKGEEIGRERLVVIASKAKQPRFLKLSDLRGINWILNPEGCGARAGLQRALRRADVEVHVAVETYNYELQLNLVSRNRGWSLIPSRILERSKVRTRLREIRVEGLRFPMKIWTVSGQVEARQGVVIEHLSSQLMGKLTPAIAKRIAVQMPGKRKDAS